MGTLYHSCRRARREDIRRTLPLWERDRDLYDADVWHNLPSLLEDLWERELVSFAIIESIPSLVPRMFGGISFVHAEYVTEALKSSSPLTNFIFGAAIRGQKPFLTPREIAKKMLVALSIWLIFLESLAQSISLMQSWPTFMRPVTKAICFCILVTRLARYGMKPWKPTTSANYKLRA